MASLGIVGSACCHSLVVDIPFVRAVRIVLVADHQHCRSQLVGAKVDHRSGTVDPEAVHFPAVVLHLVVLADEPVLELDEHVRRQLFVRSPPPSCEPSILYGSL
jgi:hypothetical protein